MPECYWQTHYGCVGPIKAVDPTGPTGYMGICGRLTENPSGFCDEHEQMHRENYPNIPLAPYERWNWHLNKEY